MRRFRTAGILLAFLVLVGASLLLLQMEDTEAMFSVKVPSGAGQEEIMPWISDSGEYYVFLPSYARVSGLEFCLNTENAVFIGTRRITDGMSGGFLQPDTAYELRYSAWGRERRSTITFVQSEHIPAMFINTESGNMDYIHQEKGNEESGFVALYTADGSSHYEGGLESINGRGNNTWEAFEKKPYSISLADDVDLLGMGVARKWILLANADDPSNMRNKIVYDFASRADLAYSPESRWVDLYLNGEYAGLYLLSERNERGEERINISASGSFVVSLEKYDRLEAQNYTHIMTDARQALRVHYMENETSENLARLDDLFQSLENALLAEDGIDPETGKSWLEMIDLDSWVRKYLIEEVFANGDACFISQFFYMDGSELVPRVYAGPVWDYDHTMGTRVAWALMIPNSLYANRLHVKDGFDAPWFYALYQKELFYNQMVGIYESDFMPLWDEFVKEVIPGYVELIAASHEMNRIRWSAEAGDVQAEAEEITTYMAKRMDFLCSIWLEEKPYVMVKADQGFGGFYGYYVLYPGECLRELPQLEDTEYQTFLGWYYRGSNEPVDPEKPVTEDMEIYARYVDSASKRLGQALKLVPLAVIACMGLGLAAVEISRMRKNGGRR